MFSLQQLKKQLLPLIKGSPIIAIIFILFIVLSNLIIRYSNVSYQSMAKIKLDDQQFGFSHNFIYKDFEMFSVKQQIEAESELLKSPLIVGKAVDIAQLAIKVTRVGKLKDTEIYDDVPFLINVKNFDESKPLKSLVVTISPKNEISFMLGEKKFSGSFGQKIITPRGSIQITKNQPVLQRGIKLDGEYLVEFFSREDMINDISKNLDVKAADKETPILRVVYKNSNPEKAADIVNAICEAYIQDYVDTKSSAASQTVNFIDTQLEEIEKRLANSENTLEDFKIQNGVVNTRQETETGLRQLSQLQVDMINMDINVSAMKELQEYIDNGDYYEQNSINFGFGDLVLTELVKKLNYLTNQRKDLLIKYSEDNELVTACDAKIQEAKDYITEAINRNLSDIEIRQQKLSDAYEIQSHQFDGLPTREKNQHILEREFIISEQVYNFLSQKRIDAQILANSLISFHRVIQPAHAAKNPVSPNKTLITFVCGLFGLIIGISWVYLRQMTRAKVNSRSDIEKHSENPVAGIIREGNISTDFEMLLRSILLKKPHEDGYVLTISSAMPGEGKSYTTSHLAETISQMGHSVCILSVEGPKKSVPFDLSIDQFILSRTDLNPQKRLNELKDQYDFVLVRTLPTTMDLFGVELMRHSNAVLFILRANQTSIDLVKESSLIAEEYALDNIFTVLNCAHKASNYSGNYIGTKYLLNNRKRKGFIGKVQSLYKIYVRS